MIKLKLEQFDVVEHRHFESKRHLSKKGIKRAPRSRNFAFTDWKNIDLSEIYRKNKDIIRYICWGKEIAPKTGRIHSQGWIQLYNPKSEDSCQKIFESKVLWIRRCFANEYKNDTYCKKDNNFTSFGKFVSQGQRTDLEHVKKMIDEHKPMLEVAGAHFGDFVRYHSGLNKYRELVLKNDTARYRPVDVSIYYGSTGTGKTRKAMELTQFKIQGSDLKWWDGYEGETNILIDEYNNDVNITQLLGILDCYQLRLPIKGSHTYANWSKVIITTNLTKDQLHPNAKPEHRRALFRRISNFVEFKAPAT